MMMMMMTENLHKIQQVPVRSMMQSVQTDEGDFLNNNDLMAGDVFWQPRFCRCRCWPELIAYETHGPPP